jgi:hypothetical protein
VARSAFADRIHAALFSGFADGLTHKVIKLRLREFTRCDEVQNAVQFELEEGRGFTEFFHGEEQCLKTVSLSVT